MSATESSGGMSASSLSAMQEMTKATIQASQHPDLDAIKYRKFLVDMVEDICESSFVDAGPYHKIIACIAHCMEEFPQIFVASTQYSNFDRPKRAVCTSFSRWFSARLLLFLSMQPRDAEFEDQCVELMVQLLKLAHLGDLPFFSKILSEFISFAVELQNFRNKCGQLKFKVEPFPFEPNEEEMGHLDFKKTLIVIESNENCDRLQVIIVKVLSGILSEMVQCLPRGTDFLWMLLCHCIDTGSPSLRLLALKSLTSLRSHTLSLPSNPQLKRLVFTCIINSVSFIASAKGVPQIEIWESTLLAAIQTICYGPQWIEFVMYSDVPSSLLKTLTLLESFAIVGEAVGNLVTDIVNRCSLSTEAFSEVQVGVVSFLHLNMPSRWFSRLLSATITREGLLASWLEKPKNSPDRIPQTFITSCSPSSPGREYLKRTETWKIVFQHWNTAIGSLVYEDVDGVLSKLLTDCQMIEVLVFLKGNDKKFDMETIFLQSWDVWISVIREAVSWSTEKLAKFYSILVRYSIAVLDKNVVHCLNDGISAYLIGLLGLPWLTTVVERDFPEYVYRDLRKLSIHFRASSVIGQMLDAICLILAFPSTMCVEFRVRLMQKSLESHNSNIREKSISALPALLHFVGSDHYDSLENSVRAAANSDVTSVSKALAQIFGFLICALSKSSKSHGSNCEDFCTSIHLTCCESSATAPSGKHLEQLHRLATTFVNHEFVDVRLEFAENLDHILSHLGNDFSLANACLTFLEDDNYDVRIAFSKHMKKYYVVMNESGHNVETFISHVKMAFLTAKGQGQWRKVETIILSLSHIGRVADDDMLLVIVIILLENLFSCVKYISSTSYLELRQIAESKKMKPSDLFVRFHKPIGKFLALDLYEAQKRKDVHPVEKLKQILQVFGFANLKSLIEEVLPDLLPHLVRTASQDTTILLQSLAQHLQKDKVVVLLDNFKYIFRYLICNCTKTEMEYTLQFIQKETECDIGSLLRCDCQRIQNELLLQIGNYYDQVFLGLGMLASVDDTYIGSKTISSPEQMADFLQPRFLGFLTFFDALMQKATVPFDEKLSAIRGFVRIINLMGSKHITAVRLKVLATLRITLRFREKDFVQVCCQAWDAFIRRLDITMVGPMLSQIVVTILPLLIDCQHEVANTMNYLFVENRQILQNHFRDLCFIPEVPGLDQVHSIRMNFQGNSSSSPNSLASSLMHSCRVIAHENVDVRLYALKNLKSILVKLKAEVRALILGQDGVDPLISKLVHSFMAGCRDSDPRIRELIGECLGELGAIDPGRLELQIEAEKGDESRSCSDIDAELFAIELVTELARAYLAAVETRIQDCSSYALQEVLRVYEFQKTDGSNSLWDRLADDVKEIVSLLLDSKYAMARPAVISRLPQPIYCSMRGRTFHDWMKCWTAHLASKVTRPRANQIFMACSMIMRNDLHTCQFLLPRILMCVLQEGDQRHIDEAYQEVLTVLNNTADTMMYYPELHHMSVQTVFSLLDFLRKWVAKNGRVSTAQQESTTIGEASNAALVCNVQSFLDRIPDEVLAWSSFKSQAYTRALMHLEIHIKNNPDRLQNELSFLQKLYAALDEPDGVAGVISVRRDASLEDLILSHESTGQLQDAQSCYERAIHLDRANLSSHQGLLRCMLGLDQPHMALTYANGLLTKRPDWSSDVNHFRVEASLKLASWDDLDKFLKYDNNPTNSWEMSIGKIIMNVKAKEKDLYIKEVAQLRLDQMAPLSAASMENGSYQRGYDFLVRLHMVNEVTKGIMAFTGLANHGSLQDLLSEWHERQQLVQQSTRCLEPLMSLRRVLLGLAIEQMPDHAPQLEREIGRCWLHSAKVARKCGHFQRAYGYLRAATKFQLPEICCEQAKWHWHKGEQDLAISSLNEVIRVHYSEPDKVVAGQSTLSGDFGTTSAKTKLLLARYTEESGHLESNAMIEKYKEVISLNPEWEDGHFFLARYLDRILINANEKIERRGELVVSVIRHFGHSLLYGCHYIYQSLPRLLSLWLDSSANIALEKSRIKKGASSVAVDNMDKTLSHIHKNLIAPLIDKVPSYLFLTAFSQLVSRICHSNLDVFSYIKDILAKLLMTYPQQAMWMMTSVSKSSYKNRFARCQEIFSRAQRLEPKLCKFLVDAVKLTDMLLELSNKQIPMERKQFSLNKDFHALAALLKNPSFSSIMLPIQSSMTVKLPTGHGACKDHEPFPEDIVCIASISDTVELMPSLQRPKKFSFIGTDGQIYPMMCKPKDDLRKDSRLMEFNSVVNKFLLRDTESRRRQLHIRTYAVVPLNEECGLIEWVPNLSPLRSILDSTYKAKGLYLSGQMLKNLAISRSAPIERKVEHFRTKLLAKFPPVLGEYLLKTFPDPTAWYLARLSFARTAAVMSMVGYILGLGDRHGENILFDCSYGDVVHVDFNCLFNKGETFNWPEVVPFRLTHNMVDAMGPLGCEGVYRKSCEVSLRVMRKQRDTLMSILRPFVHDPLLEFCRSDQNNRAGNQDELGEVISEKAKSHVQDIEHRLEGKLKNKTAKGMQSIFPLSTEGQVNYLILEATNERNLAQMYIGWAPHM